MSLKNHYAQLGVPHAATSGEIRTAFRRLAKTYHPDTAPDNPFAETHFREIQEAYETLSDPARRARYDEELWLRGLTSRSRNAQAITPQWLLLEAGKLRRHMETIDSYRMNHVALKEYVEALLSDEHLSVLQQEPDHRAMILEQVLHSITKLSLPLLLRLRPRLELLAMDDHVEKQRIADAFRHRQEEADWDRRRPWIVLGFALLICALIWVLRSR